MQAECFDLAAYQHPFKGQPVAGQMAECFDLAVYQHPFKGRPVAGQMQEGATVAEIVRSVGIDPRFLMDVQVTISSGLNASVVPVDAWGRVCPKAGSHVLIGPKIHAPVVAVVAAAFLPAAATFVAGSFFAAGTWAYALTYAAVTIVGALLISSLIPPPAKPNAIKQDDPNFSITGSANAQNRYGIFPTVLGRHLIYPPKTATGYTEGEADNIHFRGRYTFGFGPVALETLNIGTTPITEFAGVEIEFLNVDQAQTLAHMPELADKVIAWHMGDAALSLYPDDISEDDYSVLLSKDEPVLRATRDRAISVSVDVTYQGLVQFDDSNNKQNRSVTIRYRYCRVGTGLWVDAGTETHTARSTASLRYTKTIALPEAGEYDIEVTRISDDSDDAKISDTSYLTAIRSVQSGALPSHADIAEIAIRVKASDQLNGPIDTLNAIAHQLAPVWDGKAWTDAQPVRHPAWIYARALMGPSLDDPVTADRLQLDDLRAWAEEEPHWTCDGVIDQSTTLAEVLDLICASGRARRGLRDLKYSVIRDGGAGPIVQHFNPRNSWGFAGTIRFPKDIHGFRLRCLSERLEWQQDEIIVYADGYDETNASAFETLELRGVVLSKDDATGGNAWRLGRYHLAQAMLRPEEFTWQCDLEHLRVNMGDKVRLVHDVPLIGVGAGRITDLKAHFDGSLASFTIDEDIPEDADGYRVCWRCQDCTETLFQAELQDGLWRVSASQGVAFEGLALGDLVSIEQTTVESMEVLVNSITHQGDMKATLTGVAAAPAVLQADSGTIPPYVPNITRVASTEDQAAQPYVLTDASNLADAQEAALDIVKTQHAEMLLYLTGDYSAEERDTFTLQLGWASDYQSNGDAQAGAFLSGLFAEAERLALEAAGDDPAAVMADRITQKNNRMAILTVAAGQAKNEAEAAIAASATVADLEQDMPGILQAMIDAEQAALSSIQQADA